MATTISWQEVYARLKRMIADIKNMDPEDVLARHTLRGDLRFTEAGVRALAPRINEEFADEGVHVTPGEVAKAKTVRDLFNILWSKISP